MDSTLEISQQPETEVIEFDELIELIEDEATSYYDSNGSC
jgi:hypothetical protein